MGPFSRVCIVKTLFIREIFPPPPPQHFVFVLTVRFELSSPPATPLGGWKLLLWLSVPRLFFTHRCPDLGFFFLYFFPLKDLYTFHQDPFRPQLVCSLMSTFSLWALTQLHFPYPLFQILPPRGAPFPGSLRENLCVSRTYGL